jgi:hypothetical protein
VRRRREKNQINDL